MKKVIFNLTLLFLLNGLSVQSQNIVGQKPEKNVPAVVSRAFDNRFPSQDPVWFSQYQGRYNQQLAYEARFIFDKRYSSAFYDKEGGFIAFATAVEYEKIPKEIRDYMKQNFPSFSIMDAIFVTTYKEEKTYELGIIIDGEYIIKVFSETGEFIKSTRA